MKIEVLPEMAVDLPAKEQFFDLRERAAAACLTAEKLGLDIDEPDDMEKSLAASLVHTYAEDPVKASKSLTEARMSQMSTASLQLVNNILQDFGKQVATSAAEIRHLITNKLLLETENDDAKVRLRALELLGKISDVGLFTEKQEVTITHQTTAELRDSLRSKLNKIIEQEDIVDADVIEEVPFDE